MKRMTVFVAVALGVAITLTGCAAQPPLKAADVVALTTLDKGADLLVGDTITVTASSKLLHKRKDRIKLAIEQSTDGKTWTSIAKKTAGSPTSTLSQQVKLSTAGTLVFRSEVSTLGAKSKVVTTSTTTSATVYDIKDLVRTLYYDETQAYRVSTVAGIAFDTARDYPGEFDTTSAAWINGVSADQAGHLTQAAVPDLTTISPAPNWLDPGGTCNAAGTAPPKGRTFIVTVNFSSAEDGYLPSSGNQDVHVTLLGGKVYFYEPLCY